MCENILGSLLGEALGDSIGLWCEGLSPRRQQRFGRYRQRFFLGKGMCSDDTEHALMTASARSFPGANRSNSSAAWHGDCAAGDSASPQASVWRRFAPSLNSGLAFLLPGAVSGPRATALQCVPASLASRTDKSPTACANSCGFPRT